jgi:hypothetical protein
VNAAIVAIGLPTIVSALIYIGRKLQVLDNLKMEVDTNIRPDLKDVRERLATWEGKSAGLYQSQSPISLTKEGRRYLLESGLLSFIDENQEELMQQCDHERSMQTPYDVQQVAFEFFDELDLPDDIEQQVKTFAYNHGVSMDSMRRIAGIYFRDLCLKAHRLSVKEIDD